MTQFGSAEATPGETPGRCGWCRRTLPAAAPGPGRPRRFCRPSCRQRAYEQRRRAAELGAADDELVLSRAAHEELLDRLDVLRRMLADLRRDDVAGDFTEPAALRGAFDALVAAVAAALGPEPTPAA